MSSISLLVAHVHVVLSLGAILSLFYPLTYSSFLGGSNRKPTVGFASQPVKRREGMRAKTMNCIINISEVYD